MDTTKAIIINQIKSNIRNRLGLNIAKVSDEVLFALANACTFKQPRRFTTVEMSSEDWNNLADTVTLSELMNVQQSLRRFTNKGNKLFYILACFARLYGSRFGSCAASRSDHKERRYTKAEIQSITKRLDTFSDADL